MRDSPRKKQKREANNGLTWWSFGLFAVFFLNVVVQRYWLQTLDTPAALEAALLVVATACFITACLRLESRQSPRT